MEQWEPWLKAEHGISIEYAPFEDEALSAILGTPGSIRTKIRLVLAASRRRLALSRGLPAVDCVVVLREAMIVGPPIVERRLVRAGLPLIFDFDDTIWKWAAGANGFFSLARMPWKVREICRLASAVTVGSRFLAEYARRWNGNTYVVPTSISEEQYRVLPEPASDSPFRIVWTGSQSTLAHLESIRPALEAFGLQRPVILRVICDHAPRPFRNLATEFIPWSPSTETDALGNSHVGIMPLPDTEFTRGKCGCKALQYMAVGRATIVSPVGVNREIIAEGRNGLWATTREDWIEALTLLAEDPQLRRRLAEAGRNSVGQAFMARHASARFASVVQSLVLAKSTEP